MRFFTGNICIQCMYTLFEIQIFFKEKTQKEYKVQGLLLALI